jgi:hypothetical protein
MMSQNWRSLVNGIIYHSEFYPDLGPESADLLARSLLVQPMFGLTHDQEYEALRSAVHSDSRPIATIPTKYTDTEIREYLTRILARLDELRPWPEPRFTQIPVDRWRHFAELLPIATVNRSSAYVQDMVGAGFRQPPDDSHYYLLLRLPSGTELGFIWPYRDNATAIVARTPRGRPSDVVAELLDASTLPPDSITLMAPAPPNSTNHSKFPRPFLGSNLPPAPPPDLSGSYDRWTRRPIVYYPVVQRGVLVGCIWASKDGNAAGYFRRIEADPDNITRPDFWDARLDAQCRQGIAAEAAIQSWIGVPEDPRMGGIPAGARVQAMASTNELWNWLNPSGPPLGEGPWVQDGEFPGGTPEDRSKGWSTPVVVNSPTYAPCTTTPVHYYLITKNGQITGYLWASVTELAAGHLPRVAAGRDGQVGAGLWKSRLSRAYEHGLSAVDAIRSCRTEPYDEYSGIIGTEAPEGNASSLSELEEIAVHP